MEILRVYGTKNGMEKLIFANLANTSGAIRMAKKTAAEHGYTITRAIIVGTWQNGYRDIDATEKFN